MATSQSRLSIAIWGVILLSPLPSLAQEFKSGNPLRFADRNPASYQKIDQGSAAYQQGAQSVYNHPTSGLPPEIQDALYPQQTSVRRNSNTVLSTNQEPVENTQNRIAPPIVKPESHFQADSMVQAATHIEPVSPLEKNSLPPTTPLEVTQTELDRVRLESERLMEKRSSQPDPIVIREDGDYVSSIARLPKPNHAARTGEFSSNAADDETQAIAGNQFEAQAIAGNPVETHTISSSSLHTGETLESLLAKSNSPSALKAPAIPTAAISDADSNTNGLGFGLTPSGLDGQPDFQAILQKIATSTCIVLFLGVGFVFAAKRWMSWTGSTGSANSSKRNGPSRKTNVPQLRLVSNLRLTPKSNLHLIEIDNQRVLVASDLSGIKSVVSLQVPFSAAMESLESLSETAANPEQDELTYRRSGSKSYSASQSTAEIEADMQRKLSELLGGEAFKDVFYKANRAVA